MSEASEALANRDLRRPNHRLSPLAKTLYGSGALVDGMISTAINTFLFFYMTAVCGLSGSLAGLSLVIALLVDSVADPLIGSLSDNTHTRLGRRHPWMLAAIPLLATFGLLFSAPPLKGMALFAYMTATAIGARVALSLFSVPYVALAAELSDDYTERSAIVGYRYVFQIASIVVCPALVYLVFMPSSGALLHRAGYAPFGWTCAVVAALGALIASVGTRETIAGLHEARRSRHHPLLRFVRELGEVFRNRSFLILFAGSLIYFIAIGILNSLSLHNAKFFWRLSNDWLQWLTIATAAGAVAGIPLAAFLQRYIDKHTLLKIILVLDASGLGLVPLLRIWNVIPAAGILLIVPLILLNVFHGLAQILAAVAYYSMTADAADEHELLFHARREGLFFSGLSFSSKAASALGAFVAGIGLDWIGFPSAIAEKGPALHIPAHTITSLALLNGPLAAVLMGLPAILIRWYRIDRAAYGRIREALDARRDALAATAVAGEAPVLRPACEPAS